MEYSANEFFFAQLAEAGSYWGMRYANLRAKANGSDFFSRCSSETTSSCEKLQSCEFLELIKERNKIGSGFSKQATKLELRGHFGFQLIQAISSLASSVLGGSVLAIIVFTPLHVLSELAEGEIQFSHRSFLVIDVKNIKDQVRHDGEKSNSRSTERTPLRPPAPPTDIRIQLVPQ